MMATTSAPRLYWPSSEASGRFTLMMMSASFSASALTVAPTAVNSESGRPDLMPAPGSTATSAPSALNFLMVSGEAATRGSDGSISLTTAIFMSPSTVASPADPVVDERRTQMAPPCTSTIEDLREERPRQCNNRDYGDGAPLRKPQKPLV